MRTVVAWSESSGARFWRLRIPFAAINDHSDWNCYISQNAINDIEIANADVIVLHNVINKEGISSVLAYCHERGKKLIVDVDDALFVNDSNPHKKRWDVGDATFVISQTIKKASHVTCTTEKLQTMLRELNPTVSILPNCYNEEWFRVQKVSNTSKSVRIGWAGGSTHYDDFVYIAPIMDTIMDKYPQVKMVICGDPRFKSLLKHKDRVEIFPAVPIEMWPMRLAGMAIDIGIAPLADNQFNLYKSPIKWMEYSLLKIPSVCSKIVYGNYHDYCAYFPEEWIEKLSLLIEDKGYRSALGENAYQKAIKFNINTNYKKWMEVYG